MEIKHISEQTTQHKLIRGVRKIKIFTGVDYVINRWVICLLKAKHYEQSHEQRSKPYHASLLYILVKAQTDI